MIEQIIGGKFITLEELGNGKTGTIYKARLIKECPYGKAGDIFAIKKYNEWVLAQEKQPLRIERELRKGIEINSEHVVKIFDIFSENKQIYLVMEYLEGITLTEWICNNKYPEFNKVKMFVLDLVDGLKSIHKNNLIHRDLKPDNIMVTDKGLVILDLGVLKELDLKSDITGNQFLGTIAYSSHEMLFNESYTHLTDIYSLGIIIYEIIFGVRFIREEWWANQITEISFIYQFRYDDLRDIPKNIIEKYGIRIALFIFSLLNCIIREQEERISLKQIEYAFKKEIWKEEFRLVFETDITRIKNAKEELKEWPMLTKTYIEKINCVNSIKKEKLYLIGKYLLSNVVSNNGSVIPKNKIEIKICSYLQELELLYLGGSARYKDFYFYYILEKGWYTIFFSSEIILEPYSLSNKELEKLLNFLERI